MDRTFMIVPHGTWDYWDDVFVKCYDQYGIAEGFVLIASRRSDANGEADARDVEARLAFGLHLGKILSAP